MDFLVSVAGTAAKDVPLCHPPTPRHCREDPESALPWTRLIRAARTAHPILPCSPPSWTPRTLSPGYKGTDPQLPVLTLSRRGNRGRGAPVASVVGQAG